MSPLMRRIPVSSLVEVCILSSFVHSFPSIIVCMLYGFTDTIQILECLSNQVCLYNLPCSPLVTVGEEDADLLGSLVKNFQQQSFKGWQLKVIHATLEGKDTLVVQPTGAGKEPLFSVSHHCDEEYHNRNNPHDQSHDRPGRESPVKGVKSNLPWISSERQLHGNQGPWEKISHHLLHAWIFCECYWQYEASIPVLTCSEDDGTHCNRWSPSGQDMEILQVWWWSHLHIHTYHSLYTRNNNCFLLLAV